MFDKENFVLCFLGYIDAGMRTATYELLPDEGLYYGEVPGFDGVYATGENLVLLNHASPLF